MPFHSSPSPFVSPSCSIHVHENHRGRVIRRSRRHRHEMGGNDTGPNGELQGWMIPVWIHDPRASVKSWRFGGMARKAGVCAVKARQLREQVQLQGKQDETGHPRLKSTSFDLHNHEALPTEPPWDLPNSVCTTQQLRLLRDTVETVYLASPNRAAFSLTARFAVCGSGTVGPPQEVLMFGRPKRAAANPLPPADLSKKGSCFI